MCGKQLLFCFVGIFWWVIAIVVCTLKCSFDIHGQIFFSDWTIICDTLKNTYGFVYLKSLAHFDDTWKYNAIYFWNENRLRYIISLYRKQCFVIKKNGSTSLKRSIFATNQLISLSKFPVIFGYSNRLRSLKISSILASKKVIKVLHCMRDWISKEHWRAIRWEMEQCGWG